jgi:hypothetical protein
MLCLDMHNCFRRSCSSLVILNRSASVMYVSHSFLGDALPCPFPPVEYDRCFVGDGVLYTDEEDKEDHACPPARRGDDALPDEERYSV